MEKRCPYCGGEMDGNNCLDCGAIVPLDKQLDPGEAPEIQPAVSVEDSQQIPWERRKELGFWNALLETFKQIVSGPSEFFAMMSKSGDFGGPLIYAIILAVVAVIGSQIWAIIGLMPLNMLAGLGGAESMGEMAATTAFGVGNSIVAIILAPIGVGIGLFVGAGVLHLMLMIVGGATESYETTFRCMAYSQTAQIAQLIPFIGGLIAAIWGIVLQVIAIREAHEISQGKAILAVVLPMIICCIGMGVLFAIFGVALLGALGSAAN